MWIDSEAGQKHFFMKEDAPSIARIALWNLGRCEAPLMPHGFRKTKTPFTPKNYLYRTKTIFPMPQISILSVERNGA